MNKLLIYLLLLVSFSVQENLPETIDSCFTFEDYPQYNVPTDQHTTIIFDSQCPSLVLPEGVTLLTSGTLLIQNLQFNVEGTLFNSGTVELSSSNLTTSSASGNVFSTNHFHVDFNSIIDVSLGKVTLSNDDIEGHILVSGGELYLESEMVLNHTITMTSGTINLNGGHITSEEQPTFDLFCEEGCLLDISGQARVPSVSSSGAHIKTSSYPVISKFFLADSSTLMLESGRLTIEDQLEVNDAFVTSLFSDGEIVVVEGSFQAQARISDVAIAVYGTLAISNVVTIFNSTIYVSQSSGLFVYVEDCITELLHETVFINNEGSFTIVSDCEVFGGSFDLVSVGDFSIINYEIDSFIGTFLLSTNYLVVTQEAVSEHNIVLSSGIVYFDDLYFDLAESSLIIDGSALFLQGDSFIEYVELLSGNITVEGNRVSLFVLELVGNGTLFFNDCEGFNIFEDSVFQSGELISNTLTEITVFSGFVFNPLDATSLSFTNISLDLQNVELVIPLCMSMDNLVFSIASNSIVNITATDLCGDPLLEQGGTILNRGVVNVLTSLIIEGSFLNHGDLIIPANVEFIIKSEFVSVNFQDFDFMGVYSRGSIIVNDDTSRVFLGGELELLGELINNGEVVFKDATFITNFTVPEGVYVFENSIDIEAWLRISNFGHYSFSKATVHSEYDHYLEVDCSDCLVKVTKSTINDLALKNGQVEIDSTDNTISSFTLDDGQVTLTEDSVLTVETLTWTAGTVQGVSSAKLILSDNGSIAGDAVMNDLTIEMSSKINLSPCLTAHTSILNVQETGELEVASTESCSHLLDLTINNNGKVIFSTNVDSSSQKSSIQLHHLINKGSFTITDNSVVTITDYVYSNQGIFNQGLLVLGGHGLVEHSCLGNFVNYGEYLFNDVLCLNSSVQNDGELTVTNSSTLLSNWVNKGTFTIGEDTILVISGPFESTASSVIQNYGDFSIESGDVFLSGQLYSNFPITTINSNVVFNDLNAPVTEVFNSLPFPSFLENGASSLRISNSELKELHLFSGNLVLGDEDSIIDLLLFYSTHIIQLDSVVTSLNYTATTDTILKGDGFISTPHGNFFKGKTECKWGFFGFDCLGTCSDFINCDECTTNEACGWILEDKSSIDDGECVVVIDDQPKVDFNYLLIETCSFDPLDNEGGSMLLLIIIGILLLGSVVVFVVLKKLRTKPLDLDFTIELDRIIHKPTLSSYTEPTVSEVDEWVIESELMKDFDFDVYQMELDHQDEDDSDEAVHYSDDDFVVSLN
ncbi:hypothetical protein P9112_007870 [Eukaryota sp. TZLM1-RC]